MKSFTRTLAYVNGNRFVETGGKVVKVVHKVRGKIDRVSSAIQPKRAFASF